DFEDFKPLTPEALIQSNPDYILLFEKGLESLGGIDGVLQIQGINQINAGKNKQIITMDGALLSGFGPRVGQAAKELNQLLSKNYNQNHYVKRIIDKQNTIIDIEDYESKHNAN